MKCPNCGAQVSGKFCEYCGAEMPRSAPETVNNIDMQDHSSKQVINNFYFQGEPAKKSDTNEYSYGETRSMPYSGYAQQTVSRKDWLGTLLFCLLLGLFGGHQFYVGKTGKGFLYMFTVGLFGLGWVIDIILILTGHFQDKDGLPIVRDAGMEHRSAGGSHGRAINWEESPFRSAQAPRMGRKRLFFILMIVFIVLGGLALIGGAGLNILVILAVVFGVLYARTPEDEE